MGFISYMSNGSVVICTWLSSDQIGRITGEFRVSIAPRNGSKTLSRPS